MTLDQRRYIEFASRIETEIRKRDILAKQAIGADDAPVSHGRTDWPRDR